MWPFIIPFFIKKRPQEFKLRIVKAYSSIDFVKFEYSLNGGLYWTPIYCAEKPFLGCLDYDWKWEILTYKLHSTSTFEYEKEKFSSYEKIKEFEASERKRMEEGQKSVIEQRRRIQEEKEERLRKINENL